MASDQPPISLRLPERAREWLDDTCHEARITRSELLRCAINVARAHPEELELKIRDLT